MRGNRVIGLFLGRPRSCYAFLFILAMSGGCSHPMRDATQLDQNLFTLEVLEAQGHHAEAVKRASDIDWRQASTADRCRFWTDLASAQGGVGRRDEALASFEQAREQCSDPILSAQALFRLGKTVADWAGDGCRRGLDACPATPIFRAVVTQFPAEPAARRSVVWLREIAMSLGGPGAAYEEMVRLFHEVARSELGAYLLFQGADLLKARDGEVLSRWQRLALYDRVLRQYRKSRLANDALLESAHLCLSLGRGVDALRFLRTLLSERERSYFFGSYDSSLYTRARFLLGDAIMMATGDAHQAAREMIAFVADYPLSNRRGDALFLAYEFLRDAGYRDEAHATLLRLAAELPSSVKGKRAKRILEGGQ